MSHFREIKQQLDDIGERLGDVATTAISDQLAAAREGSKEAREEAKAMEKATSRARRAVLKASSILADLDG